MLMIKILYWQRPKNTSWRSLGWAKHFIHWFLDDKWAMEEWDLGRGIYLISKHRRIFVSCAAIPVSTRRRYSHTDRQSQSLKALVCAVRLLPVGTRESGLTAHSSPWFKQSSSKPGLNWNKREATTFPRKDFDLKCFVWHPPCLSVGTTPLEVRVSSGEESGSQCLSLCRCKSCSDNDLEFNKSLKFSNKCFPGGLCIKSFFYLKKSKGKKVRMILGK